MIEFNLNKNFRDKGERKEHLRQKIVKKIAYNQEKGNEFSFFSVARRSIQEVMPVDKFEAYATIAKAIEEKYNIKLTLGKDGNTDISTNRYGEHSWYIKFRKDIKEEELRFKIKQLVSKEDSFLEARKKIFAPIKELTNRYSKNERGGFINLYISENDIDIDRIEKVEKLILSVSDRIKRAKEKGYYGESNNFHAHLEKYLEELKEIKSKIEMSEDYLQYEQEYSETNISNLENEGRKLWEELGTLRESFPNIISIKDHFSVGQGDINFDDGDSEYYHYYQYKTSRGDYIDKTIVFNFDDRNEILDIELFFVNKALNDGLKEISGENYIKKFETLKECTDYLKNAD